MAEKYISEIKWRLAHVGIKDLVFIPGKSVHLSRLGALLSWNSARVVGNWTCVTVWLVVWIGALSNISFPGTWSRHLTPTAQLWQLQHILIKCLLSPPTVNVRNALRQLLLYSERVRPVLLPLQATGTFTVWSTRTYPGRLYDQGVSGPSEVVARRCVPYVPSKKVVDYLDIGWWLTNVPSTGWSDILRGWLLGKTCFHGPSSSIGGVPRQTHF